MKIARVRAHHLENIPIQTPPFRDGPRTHPAFMIEIATDCGHVGWSRAGYSHPTLVHFINEFIARDLIGEDPLRISKIKKLVEVRYAERRAMESVYRAAWSNLDIALWDIRGQAVGKPVHVLLGGALDRIPVYVTFGAAYGSDKRYSEEELAAEAKHWVSQGQTRIKTVVGRQVFGFRPVPDADDDYRRLSAVRDAIGPDAVLAVDGAFSMSLPQAVRLCERIEELDIAFLEEPLYENDPELLAELRLRTRIPIAAAETSRYSARHLLSAKAIDIMQPNVNNDGGYTGGMAIAAMAKAFNTPIGHGNGGGPHNIALQAGVENGTEVEYHMLRWMAYNAIFKHVPQPEGGILTVSTAPGTGLVPKEGLIEEYTVSS